MNLNNYYKKSRFMLKVNKYNILLLIFICIISFEVFYHQFYGWHNKNHWVSDLYVHTMLIKKFAIIGQFPIYSLWYILVYIVSGLSNNFQTLTFTSIIFLTILIVIKYLITINIVGSDFRNNNKIKFETIFSICALFLIIAMPILSYYNSYYGNVHIYLGNIAPNAWHNSTFILSMPINLILFDFATKSLKNINFKIISILFIVSILCKPNFALAFLPVWATIAIILNIKLYKNIFNIIIIIGVSLLIFIIQYYYTFIHNNLFKFSNKTIFAPLLVWGTYSPHILLSCLYSLAFPLIVSIIYYHKINIQIIISWITIIIAILMMALLAEYPTYQYGNYFWVAEASNYIIFLYSLKLLINQKFDWKKCLCFMVFLLHVLSGMYLLFSFFTYQTPLTI